jgi:hypothetical protein
MKFKLSILVILLSIVSFTSLAHQGDYIAIKNVEIIETEETFIYSFMLENIKEENYTDIKLEFKINRRKIFFKRIDSLSADVKRVAERFIIPKKILDFDMDIVTIEITEIFGKKHHFGGWESPNSNRKQTNTLYSEFYADAPWRMDLNDEQGNLNSIPVHYFFHDAHLVTGTTPQVDKIDIRLKNASSNTFGPVLTFNSIAIADFRDLFSCISVTETELDVQGFDLTGFSTSNSTTIDFDLDTDFFGDDFVEVDSEFWYFNFNIPASMLVGFENVIDIETTIHYSNFTFTDDVIGLRVFRSDESVPDLPDYYRGDTHIHSVYTQNDAETGLPLCATKESAKRIGLDWITTTDHTSDFDNYGQGVASNWSKIQVEVEALNTEDPSFIYIAGQEVALNNHESDLVHMLAYPSGNDPYGFPFVGDGDGDLTATGVSVNSALQQLAAVDGFAYAAHPFATEDKLPTFPVGGGIWNLGVASFPSNGSNFPMTSGPIICNDPSASSDVLSTENNKFIKDALKGGQIWNVRATVSSTGNELDPWDVNGGGGVFSQYDTTAFSWHIKRFRQGLEVISHINQMGLTLKNQDSTMKNWKMYLSAGSDAHGSYNFSNTDDFGGFGSINDNAVGKLSTVVYCPNGMGADGAGVLDALSQGKSTLSDGPLITIGISNNGDNISNEMLMGSDDIVNLLHVEQYYLNMDFATTNEFGDVNELRFIVGTSSGEFTQIITPNISQGTVHQSFLLTDILESTFPAGVVPEDEYFYIRMELSTTKDYSAQTSVYRKSYDSHHSFTNPIWMKFAEVVPLVETLTVSAMPNPFGESFNLYVQTIEEIDVTISFYDDLGRLIYNEIMFIPLNRTINYNAAKLGLAKGVYAIRVSTENENASIKVIKDH